MPTLTLNGKSVSFEPGATILEAARSGGVDIPTLCWYPKLPIVGNCRICLVSVQGQSKLLPACATPAADGMVVETESPGGGGKPAGRARLPAGALSRRAPGEWRHGRRTPRNEFERYVVQYDVPVRTHHDLPLRTGDERPGDVMIQHDMSTCILCTRCVRACEDIQEVGVLDVGQRGEHAQIIVGGDGDPDHAGCTWCGECVRVCPTGAIFEFIPRQRFGAEALRTPDKVARSVCPYCARGLPARPPRQGRHPDAGDLALDRGEHAQPGLHLRQGPLRLRLHPAPGPAHHPADPQGLGVPGRTVGLDRRMAPAPRRPLAHHRGDGRPEEAAAARCGRSASRR